MTKLDTLRAAAIAGDWRTAVAIAADSRALAPSAVRCLMLIWRTPTRGSCGR